MSIQTTAIYYSSNREDPNFERWISTRLLITLKKMGIPLVSVTQKPMLEMGLNICVGDVGVSNQNVGRQILIGAKAATTPFVISAESDCLYPEEYFSFTPPILDSCYRYNNIWILYKKGGGYWQKIYSECGQISGRQHIIECLSNFCAGKGEWDPVLEHGKDVPSDPYTNRDHFYSSNIPIINIKTKEGMHLKTKVLNQPPVDELPFWGSADKIRKELWG